MMIDREQIKLLEALAEKLKQDTLTPEKALNNLKSAGILDENGEFTEPYSNLKEIIKQKI